MLTIWPLSKFESDFDLLGGEQLLGEGKFGLVYKVEERKPPYEVRAAKFMRCIKASEKLKVRDEIDLISSFKHENILRLVGVFEDEENFVQVLEYLSGGHLFDRIVNHALDFTEADISDLVRQICAGCNYLANLSVVHLDLKPENIMCVRPKSFHIKIVDFGFARRLDSDSETRVSEGTPEFVSPEVLLYEPVTLNTDLWSVGVLAYVLLSGLSPFCGEDNEDTFSNILSLSFRFDDREFCQVSDQAKDFIRSLLVLAPSDRLSASEAMEHPWLREGTERTYSEGEAASCSVLERQRKTSYDRSRLESFSNARTKWQKCANVILAAKELRNKV